MNLNDFCTKSKMLLGEVTECNHNYCSEDFSYSWVDVKLLDEYF